MNTEIGIEIRLHGGPCGGIGLKLPMNQYPPAVQVPYGTESKCTPYLRLCDGEYLWVGGLSTDERL